MTRPRSSFAAVWVLLCVIGGGQALARPADGAPPDPALHQHVATVLHHAPTVGGAHVDATLGPWLTVDPAQIYVAPHVVFLAAPTASVALLVRPASGSHRARAPPSFVRASQ